MYAINAKMADFGSGGQDAYIGYLTVHRIDAWARRGTSGGTRRQLQRKPGVYVFFR